MKSDGEHLGTGTALRETTDALLIELDDHDQRIWFPKSQIHDDSEVYAEGHTGEVVVTQWIAEQKGLV